MSELSTPFCLLDLLRAHCNLPTHSGSVAGLDEEAAEEAASGGDASGPAMVWEADSEDVDALASVSRAISAMGPPKSAFWRARILESSTRSWDRFYHSHNAGFFLPRTYLSRDFPCLQRAATQPLSLLEFGCGTGASLLPLLSALPHLHATGFDLSPHAIALAAAHPVATGLGAGRCLFFAGDATDPGCTVAQQVARAQAQAQHPPAPLFDAVLLLFCLSAIAPELHAAVLQRASQCLRAGGLLLLRDYGAGDEAQARFGRGAKLDEEGTVMVRRDGTLAAFLDLQLVRRHAAASGLEETPGGGSHYLRRLYSNRATGQRLRRVFVHGVFRKPMLL
jgi:methyltransferase-like protein 6